MTYLSDLQAIFAGTLKVSLSLAVRLRQKFGGDYQNFRLSWKARKLITITAIFFQPKEIGDDDDDKKH